MASSNALWRTRNVTLPLVLRGYDLVVANAVSPLLWRCPASTHKVQYKRLVRGQHLEIGPGSGYYLIESGAATLARRLTLVDLAEEPLAFAQKKLREAGARDCAAFARDILEPLDLPGDEPFDSCGLNHVLHCVPGPMASKLDRALENLTPYLADDAAVFGSTVLQGSDKGHTAASRAFLRFLNDRHIFYNDHDSIDSMHTILNDHFKHVSLRRVGAEAVFEASIPMKRQPLSSETK